MSARLSKPDAAIRTFLAIELPRPIQDDLGRIESDFVEHASALKWSAADLLHITLRFLGTVSSDNMRDVQEAARTAAGQCRPFTLCLSGLGAFPSATAPRVIWVGLERGPGYLDLDYLHDLAEDALAARGFPKEERAFSPHITLARTRDNISRDDRYGVGEALQQVQASREVKGCFDVKKLTVMRSDLGPRGPRYTSVAVYPLGAGGQEEK